jgi:hypothetical protein
MKKNTGQSPRHRSNVRRFRRRRHSDLPIIADPTVIQDIRDPSTTNMQYVLILLLEYDRVPEPYCDRVALPYPEAVAGDGYFCRTIVFVYVVSFLSATRVNRDLISTVDGFSCCTFLCFAVVAFLSSSSINKDLISSPTIVNSCE